MGIDKPLEEKNIIERYTTSDNKFSAVAAFLELERENKSLKLRVEGLEEAMAFFSDWYNKTQRANIILPDNVDETGKTKLIL